MKSFQNPYSQRAIALPTPCRSCGHERGLVIVRFPNDKGFARCGFCDSALFSLSDRKAGEVSA